MLKPLFWLLIGILLMVLSVFLMTKINRLKAGRNQRRLSVFLSVVEFIADVVAGSFTSLGGLAILMFLVGFVMSLINFLVLIHVVHA